MTPEFSRPQRLDQIGAGDTQVEIQATPDECKALAARFDLVAIERLVARFTLRRDAIGICASGHLSSDVTQSCGITGDPLPATIDEDFAIRFLPEPPDEESADEVELAEEDMDTVFYSGSALDLGEAAAETLALSLDPFPRSPDAATALKQAGVISEDEAGPLSPLAGLKDLFKK